MKRSATGPALPGRAPPANGSLPVQDMPHEAGLTVWKLENRIAINAWHDHVEACGLLLAEFRTF